MTKHSYILSIAGHDPSAGAGLSSDIKTFEAHGLYGLSVCTAITMQNDNSFKACTWITIAQILAQIDILFERFEIPVVKIGIVQSWDVLLIILEKLHSLNPKVKIVLDPIFKASAGFDFRADQEYKLLDTIWKRCYFVTPNYEEIQKLYPEKSIADTIDYMRNFTNIYLKGGHREDRKGWDEIYLNPTGNFSIPPIATHVFDKHGSGCVLSSALASNFALNIDIENACKAAKYYTEHYLNSHASALGTHIKIKIK